MMWIKWMSLVLLSVNCLAQYFCKSNEECVTRQLCDVSDDSGRGIIGPRTLRRSCGNGFVCCESDQLQSYNASIRQNPDQDLRQSKPSYQSCGQQNECVPQFLCSKNEITSNNNNNNGRFVIMPPTTNGCKFMEICCPTANIILERDSSVSRNLRNFQYKGCGYTNQNGLYYDMVGYKDHEALFGEFPWMMALTRPNGDYICGGTLIHPSLVLTSVHNIQNETIDTLMARAGEWDLSSTAEPHAHQSRSIRKIILHEQFNSLTFYNDIALLVLERPFELAPHIQPLCLPPPDSSQVTADLLNAQCFSTGWGRLSSTSHSIERILKRIDLPVIAHDQCQQQLRETILGKRFKLSPTFICAGGVAGKDTCQGDGGSPLFCTMPGTIDRYLLAGIVSWGIECSQKDVPAAYANVPYLRAWIQEKANENGIQL